MRERRSIYTSFLSEIRIRIPLITAVHSRKNEKLVAQTPLQFVQNVVASRHGRILQVRLPLVQRGARKRVYSLNDVFYIHKHQKVK